jgi:hypothetical protein
VLFISYSLQVSDSNSCCARHSQYWGVLLVIKATLHTPEALSFLPLNTLPNFQDRTTSHLSLHTWSLIVDTNQNRHLLTTFKPASLLFKMETRGPASKWYIGDIVQVHRTPQAPQAPQASQASQAPQVPQVPQASQAPQAPQANFKKASSSITHVPNKTLYTRGDRLMEIQSILAFESQIPIKTFSFNIREEAQPSSLAFQSFLPRSV